MKSRSVAIAGLPSSGKTTYLAALWHLLTEREKPTALRFESLRDGKVAHLNSIAERWRTGKTQIRTELGRERVVRIGLTDASATSVMMSFPDVSGEGFRDMWEQRECSPQLLKLMVEAEGLLFFINSDRIQYPLLTVDVATQAQALGAPLSNDGMVSWDPRFSPTQVQLVDLLQLFRAEPISVRHARIAILLSLWDKVEDEARSPDDFVSERLPLLQQYLRCNVGGWTCRVYGLSAQGGDYEEDNRELSTSQREKLQALKQLDLPSDRIRLIRNGVVSHDLTEPIAWLIS